ncbi:MAG: serine/threonine protein kinase [Bacteroidaceae bacterium]|nr:serine/threonine protein kinase [Bacteroidaceae bacterium]
MGNPADIMRFQGAAEQQKGTYYELDVSEKPLGEGGTGIVRRGVQINEQTGAKREVAIKFLFDDLTENVIMRSKREASIHIVHENLVEMLGFVQIGEADLYGRGNVHYHVISELLHGVMLLDIINGVVNTQTFEKFPRVRDLYELYQNDKNRFARFIVSGVLSGIQALHDHGYIHRDIDPSNIMITESGKVKLIDLGIAKKLNNITATNEQHLTTLGQFVGKAAYAAPELVRGDLLHQDRTTDVYAIGILLYQIITGSLPFQGSIQEVLDMQIHNKMPLSNVQDKKIRDVIRKATEKKQSDRYQSASEFRVALDSITGKKKDSHSFDVNKILIIIIMVAGLILGGLIAYFIH